MHKSVHSVNLPLLAVMLLDLLHLLLGVCNVPDLNKTITQARKHQFLLGVGVVKEGQTLDLHEKALDRPQLGAGFVPMVDAEVVATCSHEFAFFEHRMRFLCMRKHLDIPQLGADLHPVVCMLRSFPLDINLMLWSCLSLSYPTP